MGNMAGKNDTVVVKDNDIRRPTRDSFDSVSMDTTEQQPEENHFGENAAGCGKSKKKKDNRKNRQRQNLKHLQEENQNFQDENASLNQELSNVRRELTDCRKQHGQELIEVHRQLTDCRQQCEQLKDKNEAMLQRYSEVVSNQMKNNPSIQDINYQDKPRQIAEAFRGELYSRKWCDAFDVVDIGVTSERDQLEILRDLCRDSFLICTYVLIGQAENLKHALDPTAMEGDSSNYSNCSVCPLASVLNKLPEVIRDEFIQNSRQSKVLEKILQEQCSDVYATKKLTTTYGEGIVSQLEPYISSCIQICWDMLLQKPPMFLDFNMTRGCKINPEVCDFYANQGSVVEFVVWPVLYRHFGGPVLNKGIVQASSTNKS
ncbi:uncharacterized protein LOC110449540 isoform X1 [Mizuhopecten yessoensis]|uniref:Mitochondria-eating protein C-terminal domain-containing protein n=1 Tax=Mizuhopecten yessoensis TaxID=6573 RepID=A0A210QR04_MIZYE|nr:uncharacterized protein LOC110449540 isoform X1 [Mizuhopecten yessoensis]OWF51180.1 hypothetical protein KP79_PYT12310 [Mizuhopecten yessoensis]